MLTILEKSASRGIIFRLEPPGQPEKAMLLRLCPLQGGAVRVTRTRRNAFLPDSGEIVVNAVPSACDAMETEAAFFVRCGQTMARVNRQSGAVTFLDGQGMLLLAKPVTRPMFHLPGGRPVDRPDIFETVYLPAGAAWYDGRTGERFDGGQTVRLSGNG